MWTVIIWSGATGKGLVKAKEEKFNTRGEAFTFLRANMPNRHYPIYRGDHYYSAIHVG